MWLLPWWPRQGAMDPLEGTLFRVNADWPTSESTYFNLVIRLSIVKQLAIPFTTFLWRLAAPAVLANPGTISIPLKWSCTEQPQTFLFQHSDRTTARIHERCQVHAFRCGLLSFDSLNILCTQFVWTRKAVSVRVAWPTTVPLRE